MFPFLFIFAHLIIASTLSTKLIGLGINHSKNTLIGSANFPVKAENMPISRTMYIIYNFLLTNHRHTHTCSVL